MKFINIPKNGTSWGGELCYSFATELDQPSDVQVIVRDADTNEEFGRMRLYSVIGGRYSASCAPKDEPRATLFRDSSDYSLAGDVPSDCRG